MNTVCVANEPVEVKEWQGQRVVTFADVDKVHQRPDGTAKRNFKANRKRFIENQDFYLAKPMVDQKYEFRPFKIPPRGIILLTEMGYLMLVKSFTDDLAWTVQRALVQNYFRAEIPAPALPAHRPCLADIRRKTFNGVPVMDSKDLTALLDVPYKSVHWRIAQAGIQPLVLENEPLAQFKMENDWIDDHISRKAIYRGFEVRIILQTHGKLADHKDLLNDYFAPDYKHNMSLEEMKIALGQARTLHKIAMDWEGEAQKRYLLKFVTAILINIGLWNDAHQGYNGVTAEWDIETAEGWNKHGVLYCPLDPVL